MYNLKTEPRDIGVKAKRLRKMGMVPCCIYGANLEKTIEMQLPLAEAVRFLKVNSRGAALTVELGEKKYNVLFKDISTAPLKGIVEHLGFQNLIAGEEVNSVAQVVLINRESNQNLIQQLVEEIPYKALPSHLVDRVTIDLEGMEAGTSVKLEELDISKNENIKLSMDGDTMIVNIVDKSRTKAALDEEEEAASEDEETAEAEESDE